MSAATPTERRTARNAVISRVLAELTRSPGLIVHVGDLAEAADCDQRQVQSAIYHARQRNASLRAEIEVIIAGNAWRYRPTAVVPESTAAVPESTVDARSPRDARPTVEELLPPTWVELPPTAPPVAAPRDVISPQRRVFEEVGTVEDDVLLVDESGVHWRARPLTTEGR